MPETNLNYSAATHELTTADSVPPNKRIIEDITTEILLQKKQIVQSFLEIGNLLIRAKGQMTKHGEWLEWLSTRVDISDRMAQRYMQVARAFSNTSSVTDLGMTKALALLALPESKRETFIGTSHEINGKQKMVSEMSTRELKKAIREQNQANCSSRMPSIYNDGTKHISFDKNRETTKSSDSGDLITDLKAVQKHMDRILGILENQDNNPDLHDKFADSLRSLFETVQKCLSLAQVELPNNDGGAAHAEE